MTLFDKALLVERWSDPTEEELEHIYKKSQGKRIDRLLNEEKTFEGELVPLSEQLLDYGVVITRDDRHGDFDYTIDFPARMLFEGRRKKYLKTPLNLVSLILQHQALS